MKTTTWLMVIFLFLIVSSCTDDKESDDDGNPKNTLLQIGDTYQGGIIFYFEIGSNNQHGYIAAPADLATDADWGCVGTYTSAGGTMVGEGQPNTAKIIAACSTANIAARLCDNLVINEYSDWYLPCKDELAQMYINLKAKGLGGFSNADYWSSTESDKNSAWGQTFGNGKTFIYTKAGWNPCSVRAVRKF